jgi:3-oxoacyl-[acyl-carrier protein] reductase
MERFKGQVAIITGSGSGIGRAIAARLAQEGARVCVAHRNKDAANLVAEEIRAHQGDARAREIEVTDQEMVGAAVAWVNQHIGPVDILVNNAASAHPAPLGELSEDDWDSDLALALKGPFLCTRAVLPVMVERRGGVVLNLGSVNG